MDSLDTLAGRAHPLDAYRTTGSSPTPPTLHLVGAGRVGCAFLDLLQPCDGRLVAATDSSGTIRDPGGLDPREVARWKRERGALARHPLGAAGSAAAALEEFRADVVIDATATDFARPEWADALQGVVARGGALAFAAKDAPARRGFDWSDPGAGARCGVNGALGGAGAGIRDDLALLRADCASVALAGSASTTVIVSALESGATLEEGIAVARARGLLEADPELDFRGLDAVVKLAVVARLLWNHDVRPDEVPCPDIRDLDPELVRERAGRGRTTRLVGRALRTGEFRVDYEEVPAGTALATTSDRVAYAFELRGGRALIHAGGGLGPDETARAVLADVQALAGRRATARRSSRIEGELGTGIAYLPGDFRLGSDDALHPAQVAFESRGPEDAPAVLVLGGISAHRHAADAGGGRGWWPDQVGPGRAIDTLRYRVLSLDYLGGAGGSTGPVSAPHWPPHAPVAPADQARAVLAVLDALGVERLHLAAGASYGGTVVLELVRLAPERVRAFCVLGAGHRPHPQATAFRSLQRRIVRLGQETGRDHDALALARGLGMVTYRSPEELASRFAGPPADGDPRRFPVEAYLEARGRDFASRFDARAFLCLSESLEHQEVEPEQVRTPGTFVAFEPDALAPRSWVEDTARRLGPVARTVVVPTRYGHDGFLKEHRAVAAVLTQALEREVVA